MTAAHRSLLAVPVAFVAAGTLAFAPTVVAPATAPAPVVHVEDIALAGIGQDIYYAITPVVQYAVGGVSYLINGIPLIGGPIAAQININYFQLVQPVIEATVNYAAAVVQNPLNIIGATTDYGATLYDIGYNWVSAEAVFFGLPPLPPLPPLPQGAAVDIPRGSAVPGGAAAVAGAASVRRADRATRAVARQGTRIARPAAVAEPADAHQSRATQTRATQTRATQTRAHAVRGSVR